MKTKLILYTVIILLQSCAFDSETRMRNRIGGYVGDKFDLYQFINMTPAQCNEAANQDIYRMQHHLPRKFKFFPWNPLNFRKDCGIHKVGETGKTVDYQITYYGTCKYIYTVDKKSEIILSWRYTKDSKNCVPGP